MLKNKLIILYIVALIPLSCSDGNDINISISRYPDGKDFAFTITDDPDYGQLEEKPIIYDMLYELGFRTTVPIWVLDNKHGSGEKGLLTNTRGVTTTNKKYLKYIQELQEKGFEIALHTAGPGNDLREETIEGYKLFKEQFGHYPKININHANNLEDIYWGGDRFSNRILRFIFSLMEPDFQGHREDSKYFWGDISKEKTKYVRGWCTDDINSLSVNKSMPYHLKDKPHVNYWFGCSDGYNYDKFRRLISDKNIKKLLKKRGTSIVYTHFAYGFIDKQTKVLKEDVKEQLTKLSKLDGWFVPAATILDRFMLLRNVEIIKNNETVLIINHNNETINGLTVLTDQKKLYSLNSNKWIFSNEDGEMVLGNLPPYSVFKLGKADKISDDYSPRILERITMVWSWFIGRFNK